MDGAVLQIGGSLVAILILAAIAWALKLGPSARIEDEDDARRFAREADTRFDPQNASVSRGNEAAILDDRQGRIMVLRRHGTHFAGRVLEPGAHATRHDGKLTIATTDRRFGLVTLDLGDAAQAWELRVDALNSPDDA